MRITTVGCLGAYPRCNESTSSFLVEAGGRSILLDCGSGVMSRVQNYIDLKELDAVVISHYHADHVSDIYCLHHAIRILRDLGERDKPLHIYSYSGDSRFETMSYEDCCIAHPIDSGMVLDLWGMKLRFMENNHPLHCLSTKIDYMDKCLVYTSDTGWVDGLVEFSKYADLLICESSLYMKFYGLIHGHLCAKEAGSIASDANVKRLVLTHLPPYGNHEELLTDAAATYKGALELAASGKVWEL